LREVSVKSRLLIAMVLGVLVTGCPSFNPIRSLTGVTPEEARIERLMEWHSGEVEVYKSFQTVFTARVVYLSDEIKKSAAEWEARSRLMNPEEKDQLVERVVHKRPGNLEFLLGFYTPDDEQNVLEQDDGPWITWLKYPSGEMKRASCFGVGGEEQKIYQRFLKWDLSWSKLYILCYPDSEEQFLTSGGKATIVITGPGGKGEIDVRIAPPPED
jgi:hypothetical protein